MKRILKYPLKIIPAQTVTLPHEAVPLALQMQEGVPTLWALVDDAMGKEDRAIYMFGTGMVLPLIVDEHSIYIGTVQEGPFVWHFFWEKK